MVKINPKTLYHIIITLLFVYILVEFLSMSSKNKIYQIYTQYIMNKYYLLLYLFICIILYYYDKYTAVLLVILVIPPFKIAHKEFFENPIPTIIRDGIIIADIPKPSITSIQNTINNKELIDKQNLGIDERIKIDDIAVNDILRQIKGQVDFDPYKTNLDKSVIYEIYNRYFDNDIFQKLQKNYNDSKEYIAEGNFKYVPTVPKVDYDIITYQNLSDDTQFGISPIIDGITNKTKVNRS